MKAAASIAVLLLTLLLSACGWQLRGVTNQPNLETLTIKGATTSLRYALEDQLEKQGVLVHGESPYLLVIDDEDWMRRTSAVDAQGRQAEIELRYTLYWHIQDKKTGALLTTPARLRSIRTLPWYPENATASSDEEDLVRDDLYEDMTIRLINQIATASQRWEPY
ncbi:MAG: LPS assembly lipoprotein LptE [Pseudomonadota bacterium]|uniref:LPS-assembly lipoprotein LptE n=1 Tax=Alcanivorax sp. TaxID=1872427 RepID=UPI00243B446A|nr:LPS assembly lipoprotein LptE [Alcanivorax sp.]MEE3319736.1 LPS assembly lipoprotein LptE [Pseudomonadota bacterium]